MHGIRFTAKLLKFCSFMCYESVNDQGVKIKKSQVLIGLLTVWLRNLSASKRDINFI